MKRIVAKLPSGDWCVLNGPIEIIVEEDAALKCIQKDGADPFEFQPPKRSISASVTKNGKLRITIDG